MDLLLGHMWNVQEMFKIMLVVRHPIEVLVNDQFLLLISSTLCNQDSSC